MLRVMTLILAAALVFSLGQSVSQAYAREMPIYAKDRKDLVADFNAAAKNFGNFKMQDWTYIDTLDGCELYDAAIEGAGDIAEATIRQNEEKKVARFILLAGNRDNAENLFKAALATLQLPADIAFEEMDEAVWKNSAGQIIKVSVDFYKDENSETYTMVFRT